MRYYPNRPFSVFQRGGALDCLVPKFDLSGSPLSVTLYKSTTVGLYGKPHKTEPVGGDQATEQGAR